MDEVMMIDTKHLSCKLFHYLSRRYGLLWSRRISFLQLLWRSAIHVEFFKLILWPRHCFSFQKDPSVLVKELRLAPSSKHITWNVVATMMNANMSLSSTLETSPISISGVDNSHPGQLLSSNNEEAGLSYRSKWRNSQLHIHTPSGSTGCGRQFPPRPSHCAAVFRTSESQLQDGLCLRSG